MKIVRIIITLLLLGCAPLFAAHRYVATTGNDSNDGSISSPWATLAKVETSAVNGDIVHIGAGTFNVTSTHYLKNISMLGVDTTQTIINISSTGAYGIYFWTDDFNANAIEISNIKFTGGLVANRALYIWKKHNVYIHHCSFSGFVIGGIYMSAGEPVGTYASGLRFMYNVVYDCATFSENTTANVSLIRQQNVTFSYNVISNCKRGSVNPGALVKFNYTINCLVEYNTLNTFGMDDSQGWAFTLEFWNSNGGDVVQYNYSGGVIDLTGGSFTPGTYQYQTHIHHNYIGYTSLQSVFKQGIYIEGSSKYVLIEDNTISNVMNGIMIYTNAEHNSHHITIRRNVILVGSLLGSGTESYGIRQYGTTTGFTLSYYYLDNNTIIGNPSGTCIYKVGIQLPYGGTTSNYYIRNSVVRNFSVAPVKTVSGTGTISYLYLQNNLFYENGNSNAMLTTGGITPTNVTNTGTLTANPLLDASYVPYAGSPAIDAGVIISGITYFGSAPDIGYSETNYTAGTTTTRRHVKVSHIGKKLLLHGKIVKN